MQTSTTSQRIPISATTEVYDWVLIELNGELLPPVVMPSTDESETILGTKSQTELGRLFLANEKVRCGMSATFSKLDILTIILNRFVESYFDFGITSIERKIRRSEGAFHRFGENLRFGAH